MSAGNLETALKFGAFLDNDNFREAESLLHEHCTYVIHDKELTGSKIICALYEQNMREGRKRLDQLTWGKSRAEKIHSSEIDLHFKDFLTHKGISHTYQCKQTLFFDEQGRIVRIIHVPDKDEEEKLKAFYKKVGL